MRVIKFRAWNTGERMKKGMYSWEDMIDSFESELNPRKSLFAPFINSEQFRKKPWIVLMQFTGLKDKNGKEIYDGDTIQHNNNLYVIKFSERRCGWVARLIKQEANWRDGDWLRGCGKYIEIIGNIYENPELCLSEFDKE